MGTRAKKIKNTDRWIYFHRMPMLSFLRENHHLPLFHMAKRFIWINETKQLINEFTIGYMVNPGLNVNKDFREQVENVCLPNLVKSHNLLLNPH